MVVFDIQDHTPPTMEIQIRFLTDAEEYMKDSLSRGRVIAVHCRGGKGRTGSLVCAWLFYSGFCRTAAVTLEYVLTMHLPRSSRWPTCVYDEDAWAHIYVLRGRYRYFARARTELRKRKSKKTLQGVDTPSQKRYLYQLESWLTQLGA